MDSESINLGSNPSLAANLTNTTEMWYNYNIEKEADMDVRRLKLVVVIVMMVFMTSLLALNIFHGFIHQHKSLGASQSMSLTQNLDSDEALVRIWAESNVLSFGDRSSGNDTLFLDEIRRREEYCWIKFLSDVPMAPSLLIPMFLLVMFLPERQRI